MAYDYQIIVEDDEYDVVDDDGDHLITLDNEATARDLVNYLNHPQMGGFNVDANNDGWWDLTDPDGARVLEHDNKQVLLDLLTHLNRNSE